MIQLSCSKEETTMSETFGQRIQRLRKQKGLTQEDIAKRITISPQAVSKWENDASSPDITMIGDLADILGVSVDELLGREPSEKEEPEKEIHDEDDPVKPEPEEVRDDRVVIDDKGIHLQSEDGDTVEILDDGIKVTSADGTHVRVHSDEEYRQKRKNERYSWITSGTLMGVAIIAYIILGVTWKHNNMGWVFGWTILLDALWISSIVPMIRHKRISDLLYPLLVTSAYCKLGFLGVEYGFAGWETYWFLFLTIPAFYLIVGPIDQAMKARRNREE